MLQGQIVPDNGSGTANLPIDLDYNNVNGQWQIINGLPGGATIDIDAVMTDPATTFEQAGGSLGGTQATGTGMTLEFDMQGTGAMSGFSRPLVVIPLNTNIASFPPGGNYEMDAAPRMAFSPFQSFATDLVGMYGQITNPSAGDPDFDLLRVTAGTSFGMPSPGHTTLTQVPGNQWAVNSFFDITYRIDFVGAPGGQLGGMSGSTTGTIRMAVPEPGSMSFLAMGAVLLLRRRR
jgi:hypothetical protein